MNPAANFARLTLAIFFLTTGRATDASETFLQVWDQRKVPAPEVGLLSEVRFDKGMAVEAGQILARLDDREQIIARDRAKVEVKVAIERAESAKGKVEIKRQLLHFAANALNRAVESNDQANDAVSAAEIEQLHVNKQQADYEFREAEHELQVLGSMADLKRNDLQAAELALLKRKIIAPISGVVEDVFVKPDEWVEPGQPLLRIVRTDQLTVETLIPSASNVDLMLGQTVSLIVDMPNHVAEEFVGKIDYVSSEVGAVDGQVRIRIRIDNEDNRLRPGFQVRIVPPSIKHAD